ncbi:hypothetical protein J1N35_014201, partial [Gossypium stocksii]
CMTQSGGIPIEPYPNLEQHLRHNHKLKEDKPTVVVNLPRENPLLDEPPKQQE